jgi:hypothetical protein
MLHKVGDVKPTVVRFGVDIAGETPVGVVMEPSHHYLQALAAYYAASRH